MELKRNFDYYGIPYEFLDINADLRTMKEFLALRDSLPVFDHCKEVHDIGLPAIVLDDSSVILDYEDYLKKNGYSPLKKKAFMTCSLDGKGC